MPNDPTPQPDEQKKGNGQTTASEEECPNCGHRREPRLFRTGSVEHPGRDVCVCSGCGSFE